MPSREHSKTLRHSPGLIKQRTIYICIYRILLAHVAAWQLIQKITVAYLIVLFNICILFHFLFSDCAPISTFYSWRPTSMGFLTFSWFKLRWAAEVDAGRSSSIEELGFGLWFMGSGGNDNVKAKEKKNASAPSSVSALMQAPPLCLSHHQHLHFYGPFCSWWNVVRAVALLPSTSFCRHSLIPMRHAAFSIHVISKPCPGVWTSALVQSSNRQMILHSHLRPQLNPNSKFESASESLPKTTVHSQLGAGMALFHWNNKWCP